MNSDDDGGNEGVQEEQEDVDEGEEKEEEASEEGNKKVDKLWEVDKLMKERHVDGNLEYLVKWVMEEGKETDHTWEPVENLQADDAIEAFNNNKKQSRKRKRKESAPKGPTTTSMRRRSMRRR